MQNTARIKLQIIYIFVIWNEVFEIKYTFQKVFEYLFIKCLFHVKDLNLYLDINYLKYNQYSIENSKCKINQWNTTYKNQFHIYHKIINLKFESIEKSNSI